MRTNTHTSIALSALIGAAFIVASAQGATITVLNPSFEAQNLGGGVSTTVTNWDKIGTVTSSGIAETNTGQFTSGLPDGVNYFFTNFAGVGISQTLTTVLLANTTYNLTVAIGWRKDLPATWPNFPGYGIELWAGTTMLASVNHDDIGAISPSSDQWIDVTATYTSPAIVTADFLQIRLLAGDNVNGGNTNAIQTNFDNVRLDAIPEPSAALLGGLGALLLLRRRRA